MKFLILALFPTLLFAQTIEEITVTATKRETQLQETPISISIQTAENLEERNVQSLLDLADGSVPGLNIATFEARQTALTVGIRGIVPLDANQPAREQGVGIYIDGVYLGRQHGLNAALLDVERIEVLKGPQGTLFGRNTSGGALNIITKKPSNESRVKVGLGNYGSHIVEGHFSNSDMKLDLISQYQDPTTENPIGQGWNFFDRKGVRFSTNFLTIDAGIEKNTPFYSQLLNFDPNNRGLAPLPSLVAVRDTRMSRADIGVPQKDSQNKTGGIALNLSKDFGFAEFKSISSARILDSEQWDNSGGAHRVPEPKPNGVFSRYSLSRMEQDQISQEFQLIGPNYVTGLFYFKENAQEEAATPSTNKWNEDLSDYSILEISPWAKIDRASRATSESLGVFGQVTYGILTVGGRYTLDNKTGVLYKVKNIPSNWEMNLKTSRFNPLVILAYKNAYAKYATGYRAGGASSRSLSFNEFGPEDVDSYEIGYKYQSRRARLNTAIYHMNRTGSQIDFSQVNFDPVTQTTRNTLETLNAPGTTVIQGLEVEGQFAIKDFTFSGAYTYTKTEVPDTVNPFTGEIQPVFLVFTPENVINFGVDYQKFLGDVFFTAHADVTATDAAYAFSEYDLQNDAHTIANASVSAQKGRGRLQLWVRNLTDEEYVYRRDPQKDDVLGTYGNFNAPRTYGATFTWEI